MHVTHTESMWDIVCSDFSTVMVQLVWSILGKKDDAGERFPPQKNKNSSNMNSM